ncbi:Uncharacterised protein [Mycobacterium tuberculosis]|uniref:Uncharacterized protein n=1 Tax=Mycobacterium tuberculosis TaxID=1773 RepID=A0A654TP87_MYCTX|nr:Uncharacterised protein [Mycobacterium tuberculosis]
MRTGAKRRPPVIGGNRRHQGGLPDLQDADPVAGRHRTHATGLFSYLRHQIRKDLCGRRVRGVLQPQHPPSTVTVADHSDEPDNGASRPMAHQLLVLGQKDRLICQRGAQDLRHRG